MERDGPNQPALHIGVNDDVDILVEGDGFERPPVESDRPPVESERPPDRPPVEGVRPPVENERPSMEGERPPVDSNTPPSRQSLNGNCDHETSQVDVNIHDSTYATNGRDPQQGENDEGSDPPCTNTNLSASVTTNHNRENQPDNRSTGSTSSESSTVHDHHKCSRPQILGLSTCSIVGLFVFFLCAVAIMLYFLICHPQHIQFSPSETLGVHGNTIIVGHIDGNCISNVTVSEVLHDNDYSHVNSICVVPISNLRIHHNTTNYTSENRTQSDPSHETGSVEYIYLLQGSVINYTIYFSSESYETKYGNVYLFDDQSYYLDFVNNVNGAEKKAVDSIPLEIVSVTRCAELIHTVKKDSFYFITGSTPGNIVYYYKYTLEVNYLNRLDYTYRCGVSYPNTCPININQKTKLAVIAYITPPEAANPPTTHIKIDYGDSSCVRGPCKRLIGHIFSGVPGFLFICLIFIFLVLLLYRRCAASGQSLRDTPAYVRLSSRDSDVHDSDGVI